MQTDCTSDQIEFQGFGRRRVVAHFDAGRTSSDGGVLLLREVAERTGWLGRFAACFRDGRDAFRIEHTTRELVSQRVLGIALGYEDLNDHETLRDDALLALAAGKRDVTGAARVRERDRGHALAGKSTLNRLEHGRGKSPRYHRIAADERAIERHFVDCMLDAHAQPPARIVLDLDATDDPLHGHQEGRFFHGYYGGYCYLPLYIFCGDHLLVAKLRTADQDAAAGSVEELTRVVTQIRSRWPAVEIWIRADSGFAREAIMAWCEANDVHYVLGLAKNVRPRRDGSPMAHPVWFVRVGSDLYVDTGRDGLLHRNVRRDPRACAVALAGEAYFALRGVRVDGRCSAVDDPAEALRVRAAREAKDARIGSGLDELPGWFAASRARRLERGDRVLLRLSAERVFSWDFGKVRAHYAAADPDGGGGRE